MKKKFNNFLKENNLLGVLLILFLVIFILSWVITPGRYIEGVYQTAEAIKPIGFFDLISIPILTLARAFHIVFFVIMLGGFYGILNQIPTYQQVVKNIAKKLDGKIVIISSFLFLLLSAFSGNMFLLFLLAPFFISIIMLAKYDRMTAFAATIGAMLVGVIVAPLHSLFLASFNFYFDYNYTNFLIEKIVAFWVLAVIYIYWVNKKKQKNKPEEIPLFKNNKQKSERGLNFIFGFLSVLFFLFLAFVMFDWFHALGIEGVREFSLQLSRDSFLGLILGRFEQFGYWGSYDLIIFMVFYLMLITYIFQLKWEKVKEGFIWGANQVAKPAFYMLLTLIFYYTITHIQGQENLYQTLVYHVMNFVGENSLISYGLLGFLSTIFYSNIPELVGEMTQFISFVNVGLKPMIPLVTQVFYAIGLIFVPTSLYLVGGLVLLKIPYFEWLKYIYKILLVLTVVVLGFIMILTGA